MNRSVAVLALAALLSACAAKADTGGVASTDGGAGGDAGTGGGGGGGIACAVEPGADGKCPQARPTEIHGGTVDSTRRCRLTSGEMLGCAAAVGGLNNCQVQEATGKMYDVSVYACMPTGWRDCTDAEKQIWQESMTKLCP